MRPKARIASSAHTKYVEKTITNLEESADNVYSALLFASNRRPFSIADVRTGVDPNPLLEVQRARIPRFSVCIGMHLS
jgi:hypothetical protein